jgi:hypothetical protein
MNRRNIFLSAAAEYRVMDHKWNSYRCPGNNISTTTKEPLKYV